MRVEAKGAHKNEESKGYLSNLFSRIKRFGVERVVGKELASAGRYGHEAGLIMVEMKGAVRSGIHKLMPGIAVSIEWADLELNPSGYQISGTLRYTMLLARTDASGLKMAERQVTNLAMEMGWADVKIGTALFPQDGQKANQLLRHAATNLKEHYTVQICRDNS